MRAYNFFVSKPKFIIFLVERGRGRNWLLVFFPIFDISTHSGDIRNRSLNLSKISPNYGRFLPSQSLEVLVPQKVVTKLSCLPRGTSRGKVSWGCSPEPQSYTRIRWILSLFFNVHCHKLLGTRVLGVGGIRTQETLMERIEAVTVTFIFAQNAIN